VQKNAIKLNLISPFVKMYNLAYERVLTPKLSLPFRGNYSGFNNKEEEPQTWVRGFGFIP